MNLLRMLSRTATPTNQTSVMHEATPAMKTNSPVTLHSDGPELQSHEAIDHETPSHEPFQPTSNIVQIPSPVSTPAGLGASLEQESTPPNPNLQPRGILDESELSAFFSKDHLASGRHNGMNFPTQEALQLGQQALVTNFQNLLATLIGRRQAKADRLADKMLETEGLCSVTTERLREARNRLSREMTLLREQYAASDERKGWILHALNRYQIGFGRGMREAIELEFFLG
jgi:hypothetical protein